METGDIMERAPTHVLLVSYPGQGHINPMLRLGKRLVSKGLHVTCSTTQNMSKGFPKSNDVGGGETTPSIGFEFFDDDLPEDDIRRRDFDFYIAQLERAGKESLARLIRTLNDKGRPVSCIVNNPFLPWVCDVAEDLGVPCATLWVQSCALFASYYHYFHRTVVFPTDSEPNIEVPMPGMPVLKHDEIPTFLHPHMPYKMFGTAVLGQIENLSKSFCFLADTFEELEPDIINDVSRFCRFKPVGPLFKGLNDDHDVSSVDDCIAWLNMKPPGTVVYISFGTFVYLKQEQVDEIAHGILNSGVSFLWVMRPPRKEMGQMPLLLPNGFLERTGDRGKVVEWSPQEQVLAHPSVTCFLTHCGWNSSVEALTLGVPVVTFPRWGDQVTNAKFLVDVFGVGVRLCRGEAENRVVPRDEVERCLVEATAGEKAAEMKRNALKWKKTSEKAVAEGGSSCRNLVEFVEEIRKRSCVNRLASKPIVIDP